ncbi:hypothetical protein NEPAR06_1381 [Nematocida parisii]|uniref:Uncharacterized protein n=1 Tax=Nematocida parisii (strain ERTm3) TaxID=935791 RepID=I3EKF9_NEMP3|nr:uncharacterized protein NEPG_00759 [Nematocida parisii ERTm1]EIJ89706.1 hypothetical protein NEQG_00476 [Nematocida parisii ERTm3]KAI5126874.1 hypothetical protein NEPAR03_0705 [Nematocida parisii]EIJ94092.1 hypothetical protein NEPG_00759 [Nematocida parisii ERTm1]KAI5126954.1 hypothetical protein NEPAR08_0704 [Nematocida parisii]KAI5141064.1 hypothetical protein NEPAR04_0702 [Nematocida parisii]|eukprot:XP_013058588.1 hypothetical protein NEPG_00759 [Nematocida parisii ERTm1]
MSVKQSRKILPFTEVAVYQKSPIHSIAGINIRIDKMIAGLFIFGIVFKTRVIFCSAYVFSIVISKLIEPILGINIYIAKVISLAGLVFQIIMLPPKGAIPIVLTLISLLLMYIEVLTTNRVPEEYNSILCVGITMILFIQLDMILKFSWKEMTISLHKSHTAQDSVKFILLIYLGMLTSAFYRSIYSAMQLFSRNVLLNILNIVTAGTITILSYFVYRILHSCYILIE